jgi:excalibur calcium-binding domain-containing protein
VRRVAAIRPARWRTRNGWETEAEGEAALRLRRRFRGVWQRHDRAARRRRFLRKAARPVLFAACIAGGAAWVVASSPWPAPVTLKHYAAFSNCASARMVGLAPARAGQPGYWDRLDRDEDGVSCEWWAPVERAPQAPSPLRFR